MPLHPTFPTHTSYLVPHTPRGRTAAPPLHTPRQAFFSLSLPLSLSKAPGHICAETICPYPPGIPILLPGEIITESAIAHLQTLLNAGAILTGCQDPQLKTILAIAPSTLSP